MERASIRNALGVLVAAELAPLNVAFTNGFPGSRLEQEHVYAVPSSGSEIEFPVRVANLVVYDDTFVIEYAVQTDLTGRTHDEALARIETIMNAVIDAIMRPVANAESHEIHESVIDVVVDSILGPITAERSTNDGAEAVARIDVAVHARSERELAQ